MQVIFVRLSTEKGCTVKSIVDEKIVFKGMNNEDHILFRYHEYLDNMMRNDIDRYCDLWEFNLNRYDKEEGMTQDDLVKIMNSSLQKIRRLLSRFRENGRVLNPHNKPT